MHISSLCCRCFEISVLISYFLVTFNLKKNSTPFIRSLKKLIFFWFFWVVVETGCTSSHFCMNSIIIFFDAIYSPNYNWINETLKKCCTSWFVGSVCIFTNLYSRVLPILYVIHFVKKFVRFFPKEFTHIDCLN